MLSFHYVCAIETCNSFNVTLVSDDDQFEAHKGKYFQIKFVPSLDQKVITSQPKKIIYSFFRIIEDKSPRTVAFSFKSSYFF
jgi:hypothetical protein